MSEVAQYELHSLDDLRAAEYNPRKISERAAEALGHSLGEFGDISGIVWNSRTGNLVCGHQRVAELRKMGAQLIDGEIVTSKGRFRVRVVDWPEAKEKAANVTANNPHVAGEFTDGLGDLLDEIQASVGDEVFRDLALGELVVGASSEDTDLGRVGDITYSVIVDMDTESAQAKLLAELEERGFRCRLLTL